MRNFMTYGIITFLALGFTSRVLATEYSFTQVDAPGAFITWALGVNDTSEVVGFFKDTSGLTHGFLDTGGTFSTIDVPGAFFTVASGINNNGQIVGYYIDGTGNHGFLDSGGTFGPIDVPGATLTRANGINNVGQIVGDFSNTPGIGSNSFPTTSPFPAYNGTGFLLNPDGTIVTLNVPGASTSQAKGINDAGQIVGTYAGFSGFLDDSGKFSTIKPPDTNVFTGSNGINNAGQIVGFVNSNIDFGVHGFLDGEGTFSTIAPPVSLNVYATDIGDGGQIVGYYTDADGIGRRHGFLAVPFLSDAIPAPEPSSLALAATGVALLAVFRRRVVRNCSRP